MNQAVINRKIFKLDEKLKKYKTNHILHLLLSVATGLLGFPVWLLIWVIIAVSNANERVKINREIDKLERAMWLKEVE